MFKLEELRDMLYDIFNVGYNYYIYNALYSQVNYQLILHLIKMVGFYFYFLTNKYQFALVTNDVC